MTALRVDAHAKVNLSLEVLGKRSDGYHELRSIMQSVSLADSLSFEEAAELSLRCDDPHLRGEDNLVWKAAVALHEAGGLGIGAAIRLHKRIPLASGLGGASADAAATLAGLTRLWGLRADVGELASIGAAVGSDVPFFLWGGAALVSGRGEVVEPLPDLPTSWLVIVTQRHDLAGKTAELYRRLQPADWSSGGQTEQLTTALREGRAMPDVPAVNSFARVAEEVFPMLPTARTAMIEAGARSVHLSGAGPSLFSPFRSEPEALSVAGRLRGEGLSALVLRTLTREEAGVARILP